MHRSDRIKLVMDTLAAIEVAVMHDQVDRAPQDVASADWQNFMVASRARVANAVAIYCAHYVLQDPSD